LNTTTTIIIIIIIIIIMGTVSWVKLFGASS